MKREIDDKSVINKILTGYEILICNPINLDQLEKENPNVNYTTSKYVKENQVICLNDWDINYKHK